MTIKIIDKVGLSAKLALGIAQHLILEYPPKDGTFDYGYTSLGGPFDLVLNADIPCPLWVSQTNKRVSDHSPIEITIKKLTGI